LQVFLIAFVGVALFGESVDWQLITAIPLAFFGLFLIVGIEWHSFSAQYRYGILFGVAAALFYTVFTLTLRRLQSIKGALSPATNLGIVCLIASVYHAIDVLRSGDSFRFTTFEAFISLLALGFFSQAVGWVMITKSHPKLPTTYIGMILLLQPALAFVWDMIIFSRPTSLVNGLGVVITLVAIYLGLNRRGERAR
jgi:drug/metabolite transporter (DMT)-like permease